MTEVYAFLAALTAQILAMSVLYPSWFTRYCRMQVSSIPAERLAQVFPGVDTQGASERFLTVYRALNALIVVLGLALLAWLYRYMQRPDWADGPVETLAAGYFVVQVLPLGLILWVVIKLNLTLVKRLLERKRRAVLERRGVFDFVSPFSVFLAGLAYLLFVALVVYIEAHPFAGFAGYLNIGIVTFLYALNASVVYATVYGKKFNPLETHERRIHRIGLTVRACVYSCIACVVFLSLNFTLVLLDLRRWEPFAQSVFFVVCAFICLMGLAPPPHRPGQGPAPAGD